MAAALRPSSGQNMAGFSRRLERDHGWTVADWTDQQQKQMKAGIAKMLVGGSIVLSPEELENQQSLLAVALAEGLHPVSLLQAKEPHTIYTGDGPLLVERIWTRWRSTRR